MLFLSYRMDVFYLIRGLFREVCDAVEIYEVAPHGSGSLFQCHIPFDVLKIKIVQNQ